MLSNKNEEEEAMVEKPGEVGEGSEVKAKEVPRKTRFQPIVTPEAVPMVNMQKLTDAVQQIKQRFQEKISSESNSNDTDKSREHKKSKSKRYLIQFLKIIVYLFKM